MQENVSYCHVCLSNLKVRLFSLVSVIFTVIQNEWLATNSRNAILNNFEEYYIMTEVFDQIKMKFDIQSTLVISKSKGPSETLRDIRTSTYQMCRIEENTNRTTEFTNEHVI